MTDSPRKHTYTRLHEDLSADILKSAFIDIFQSHQQYYELTAQSLFGGFIHPTFIRVNKNGLRPSGILLDLDGHRCSDPVLRATYLSMTGSPMVAAKDSAPLKSEGMKVGTPESLAEVRQELSAIIAVLYAFGLASRGMDVQLQRTGTISDSAIWAPPGPFKPQLSSIADSWLIPLWRLAGDEIFLRRRPDLHSSKAGMAHATVLDLISKDVGCCELALRTALRVPLPPPQVDELVVIPAFECLIHIATASDFERAILDIAQAVTQFGEAHPQVCLPTVTPDRLLFQQHTRTPLGFLLDLDPLEQSSSLATFAGPHQDQPSLRFGPYDLISSPSSKLDNNYPRHILESLFYSLVWFTQANVFGVNGGITPTAGGKWLYDSRASNLPEDRTASRYEAFVMQRRAFLMDRSTYMPFTNMEPGVKKGCSLVERWLIPLWKLIGEAHFFSRWREGEQGYDWGTLGGNLTPEKFIAILQAPVV
ncbi:hypothetical protein C8F04DRAFT_1096554 [Mycena alexandri]|uniref:Uncharacterized protein n=1 Tax=Mycena alexandri TaxID=1745969 RepID=A0AAD6X442_9AGAR|nr:hypothetical protein C8F04DRAFT_1096554 [Mycena alexandri]